jgi:type VI secretion system secreted protein Hcp
MHNLNNQGNEMTAYLKVNGNSELEGDITASGLEKTTQLLSAGFRISRKMNTQAGNVGDREGTKPSMSEFVISKKVDKISPFLVRDAAAGITIPSVEIKFANTGKDLSVYHVVRLENVLISGYLLDHSDSASTSENDSKPIETITLNFTKLEVTNTPYGKDHKACSPVTAGYDLETAQPL